MVKFVVSCVTPQEAIQEIDILRDNLDLDQTNNLATQIASQRSLARRGGTQFRQTKEINKDFDVLVMDPIDSLDVCVESCTMVLYSDICGHSIG